MEFEVLRCPVCNRAYATKSWIKIASWARECLGFLFGSRGGRGRGFYVRKELRLRREVSPRGFTLVKERLKRAVRLWLQRGWLSFEELEDIIREVRLEKLAGTWLLVETERRPGFKPLKKEYGGIEVAEPLKAPMRKTFDRVEV